MDDIKRPARTYTPMMDVRPTRPTPPVTPRGTLPTPSRPAVAPPAPAVSPTPQPAPIPPKPAVPQPPVAATKLTDMALPGKVKAPIAAIVIAVMVALGLIALTIFAFLKTRTDPAPADNSSVTQQAETVTPEEVGATQGSIDEELNTTSEEQDFNTGDLDDTTLGL